jgi:radical SAM superfamily enzyme YgiQ (UPF0313 family)
MNNSKQECLVFGTCWQKTDMGTFRGLGPYRVAEIFRSFDWTVELVDFYSLWPTDKLEQYLKLRIKKNTKVVAISTTFSNPKIISDLIKKIRNINKSIIILLGGQNKIPFDIDWNFQILGYCEVALPQIIKWLFYDGAKPKITECKNRQFFVNAYAEYPAPNLHAADVEYTATDFIQPYEALSFEISRGCIFSCKFCNFEYTGMKNPSYANFETLKKRLEYNYYNFGLRNYTIADDTFNDNDAKIKILADIVTRLPFEVNFAACIRLDLLASRPQQYDLLKNARVWAHHYGIETFTHEAGKAIGKGMHPDKVKNALWYTREYFLKNIGLYRAGCSMIAGLPYETPDAWYKSNQWYTENFSSEHRTWYPYCISKNTAFKGKISQNPYEFGYNPIDKKRKKWLMANLENLNLSKIGADIPTFVNNCWLWKRENFDIVDAIQFVYSTQQKNKYLYPYTLMKYIDLYPQSEILTVQQNDLADNFCLDSYIQSKLTFAAYGR